MNMIKLTVKDSVIISNFLLPKKGRKEEIKLAREIKDIIALPSNIQEQVILEQTQEGFVKVGIPTSNLVIEVEFTSEQLLLLKRYIRIADEEGLFTELVYDTYLKIEEYDIC